MKMSIDDSILYAKPAACLYGLFYMDCHNYKKVAYKRYNYYISDQYSTFIFAWSFILFHDRRPEHKLFLI